MTILTLITDYCYWSTLTYLYRPPIPFVLSFFFPGAFISINRYLFKNDGARCSNWEIQLPFYCISDLANTKNFFCVHCVHRKSHLQHTHTHKKSKTWKSVNICVIFFFSSILSMYLFAFVTDSKKNKNEWKYVRHINIKSIISVSLLQICMGAL